MMKTKLKGMLLVLILLIGCCGIAAAEDEIRVNLNGREISFDVPPQMINDRTMVPVRAVFEAMGATVSWDPQTSTVQAVKGNAQVEMTVGQGFARVNGNAVPIDAPPVNLDGRVLVGARFAAEGFGCRVEWDGLSRIVTISDAGLLTARFLDVGQGDSELVTLPDGKVMLIDAGGNILPALDMLGVTKIDYLVATHPHSDHIAYLDEVIRHCEVGAVYMPRVSHTTQDYENLLTAVQEKGLSIQAAKAGIEIASSPAYEIRVLSPVLEQYAELNDYSAVIRVRYGDGAMIFMGDALEEAEAYIAGDVSAEVLKVGHHGSKTSTSETFFRRVNPKYGVISCGAGNPYGHPSDEILRRLSGIAVYRTDQDGHITMIADSSGVNGVYTRKEMAQPSMPEVAGGFFRTQTGSKYHIEGCRSLAKSKIPVSQKEIEELGLTPCGICIN